MLLSISRKSPCWIGIGLGLTVVAMMWAPSPAWAQRGSFLQLGFGAFPGLGAQAGFVGQRTIYTAEGLFSTETKPPFLAGEGDVRLSLGLGGALRPLGIIRLIGQTTYAYDLDVGVRFGPSLFFAANPTRSDKNRQFSLFFDPFLRFSYQRQGGRILFLEAGTNKPFLRTGIWMRL